MFTIGFATQCYRIPSAIGHIIYVFGAPFQKLLAYDVIAGEWLKDAPGGTLPSIPPGGCVCASSPYENGEVIVMKYPFPGAKGKTQKQKRTAHVYNSTKKQWSAVHLQDEHACYSAVVADGKIVVVTPKNQLIACNIPKEH